MQKLLESYHDKGIDMLKLGCTLPNFANIYLHKSTNHKFYPFFERGKDLCEKIREDMTGGPSRVVTYMSIKHIFVIRQTFARQYLELTPAIISILNVPRDADWTLHQMGVKL